jgi:hypothetical protein
MMFRHIRRANHGLPEGENHEVGGDYERVVQLVLDKSHGIDTIPMIRATSGPIHKTTLQWLSGLT